MNILPKKKWHVRTKENVARVQKDEENARIQEEHEQTRIAQAESEARLDLLRRQSSGKYLGHEITASKTEHVNLFSSFDNKTKNIEAVQEKNEDQKNWEIKVGYLKLLGQGSSELASDKPWYQKTVDELSKTKKRKPKFDTIDMMDPLTEIKRRHKNVDYATPIPNTPETVFVDIDFRDKVTEFSNERRKYGKLQTKIEKDKKSRKGHKKKKHKKKKVESSDSDDDTKFIKMQQMKEERLKREHLENARAVKLFDTQSSSVHSDNLQEKLKPIMKQKYNSQFNPHYVKSNYR